MKPWDGAKWEPRRWQREALPVIGQAMRDGGRGIVQAVTGAGKSILIAEMVHMIGSTCAPNECVIVVTPTQALVRQLAATFRARSDLEVGQFYGRRKEPGARIVVACNPSLPALCVELAALGRSVRLLVADECHGTEGEVLRETIPAIAPRWAIGFTATPFRSAEGERLTLWDRLVYSYTFSDALRDQVLVPWSVVNWDGRGEAETDAVCLDLIERYGEGPGIVSALNIDDAEQYADYLRGSGVAAAAIHSRLGATESAARLDRLLSGDLRCLVHVSMLTEGVDIPALRWLCMRRPVTAKVRFIQELGRVLRVAPGKERAIVMDPHDLFGVHGIMHAPEIGPALDESMIEEESAPREARDSVDVVGREMPLPKAIEITTQWARQVLLDMQLAGIAGSDAVPVGPWRTRRPSAKQVETLGKMSRAFGRYLPDGVRETIGALAKPEIAGRLQRGAVSDMISILFVVAGNAPDGGWQARRGWRMEWPEGFDPHGLQELAMRGMMQAGR